MGRARRQGRDLLPTSCADTRSRRPRRPCGTRSRTQAAGSWGSASADQRASTRRSSTSGCSRRPGPTVSARSRMRARPTGRLRCAVRSTCCGATGSGTASGRPRTLTCSASWPGVAWCSTSARSPTCGPGLFARWPSTRCLHLLAAGVLCTINTDDPAMFGSDLGTEHATALRLGASPQAELRRGRSRCAVRRGDSHRAARIGADFDWTAAATARGPSGLASDSPTGGEAGPLISAGVTASHNGGLKARVSVAAVLRSCWSRLLGSPHARRTGRRSGEFTRSGTSSSSCRRTVRSIRSSARTRERTEFRRRMVISPSACLTRARIAATALTTTPAW